MSNPTAQVRPPPVAAGGCEIINVPNALAKKVGVQFKLQAATSLTSRTSALPAASPPTCRPGPST